MTFCDIHAPQLSYPRVRILKLVCLLLILEHTDARAFPKVALEFEVQPLPALPIQAGSLTLLTGTCQGSLSPPPLGACTGYQPEWESMWGRCAEHCGCPWARWGDLLAECPQQLRASFLMASVTQLVGSTTFSVLQGVLSAALPAAPHLPSCSSGLSSLDGAKER